MSQNRPVCDVWRMLPSWTHNCVKWAARRSDRAFHPPLLIDGPLGVEVPFCCVVSSVRHVWTRASHPDTDATSSAQHPRGKCLRPRDRRAALRLDYIRCYCKSLRVLKADLRKGFALRGPWGSRLLLLPAEARQKPPSSVRCSLTHCLCSPVASASPGVVAVLV